MDYLLQVKRGVDYVESHLEEDIALEDVSRVAGVSHWHFLRMFKALTNETLKTYIRSRRLAQARIALVGTDDSVLAIALRAGFESQASFTRAFQRAFGLPPGKYRRLGDDHLHLEKIRIDEDYLRHLARGVSLQPEIAARSERHFVGCATTFFSVESERNNIATKIPPLWDAFLPRLHEVSDALPGVCYGLIRQAEIDSELLEYVAAVEVAGAPIAVELPVGMARHRIAAASYATFTHHGQTAALDQTVNYVYSSWLLRSGRRHSYGTDLEVYDHRWDAESEDSVMEYAIPLAD